VDARFWARLRNEPIVGLIVLTLAAGFLLRLLTLRVGYFPPVSGALRVPKR
jgi:hypothetical protein